MVKDTFLKAWNEIGNPKYKSFVMYIRNGIDRKIYAVFKNPTIKELNRLKRIEKRFNGMSYGFRYGIYKGNKYVWLINGTHEEVQETLLKKGIIHGDWEKTGEME